MRSLPSGWMLVLLIATGTIRAGSLQWQLVDDGTPLRGPHSELVHFDQSGETWIWQGTSKWASLWWVRSGETWRRRLLTTGPPRLSGPGIAYDSNRERFVYFGGWNGEAYSAATWEFDGSTWMIRTDVGAPPARGGAQLAFDSRRKVLVMFGGFGANDILLSDTWEYDGVLWRQVNVPTPRPAARHGHAMAYDEARQRVVMAFGGSYVSSFSDTWEYDGVRWVKAPPQVGLAPRGGTGVAYDPIRQKVYVFGGNGGGNETRYWTGTQWQLVTTSVSPPTLRLSPAMTFDKALGETLLFGGNNSTGSGFGDTWKFNGTRWQQLPEPIVAPHRTSSSLAYDSGVDALVVYGGNDGGPVVNETWLYQARAWRKSIAPPDPRYLEGPVSVYDPIRGRVVMGFGYDHDPDLCSDRTWLFDSTAEQWSLLPDVGPIARCDTAAVFSALHGGVVAFAGQRSGGQLLNDLWLLTSSGWSQLPAANPPPVRYGHTLTYDSARQELVAHGGYQAGVYLSDTWVLRSGGWINIDATGPGPRSYAFAAFDPIRSATVLGGGVIPTETPGGDERTWLFDGTIWSPVTTVHTPDMRRLSASAVWDPVHEAVLLAAGSPSGGGFNFNDLWAFGWDADDDLIVGRFDNCTQVSNASQTNSDSDVAGDVCDCAPLDGTIFAIPGEVTSLAIAPDTSTLTWNSAAPTSGSSTFHDVLRGSLAQLPVGTGSEEICIGTGLAAATISDTSQPQAGAGFWYLIRGRNVCGTGTYGTTSSGAARTSTVCP